MSIIQTTALLVCLAASVSAHGYVSGIVADGTYYEGYSPSFQYSTPPPTVAGWSDPENLSNGFVAPDAYADPNIICHLSATPGGTAAKVAAGGTVELQWTTWPESHHGPVLDYLAPVSGAWADIDKTSLEFLKISQGGLIDGSASPGKWASDDLIANNNTWSVTIPTGVAPGKYVLRHEIIALHSAGEQNGAQNYPQCVNLEITGSGTDSLSGGTPATSFYKADDPGVLINIYQSLSSYTIPGPALYKGAGSGSQTGAASSSTTAIQTTASAVASATGTAQPSYGTSFSMPYANSSTPAATASAVPSSNSAPAAETTAYTTVDQTATVYETVTATAASSSSSASVAPAAPSETPSLTAIVAEPSTYATPTGDGAWGEKPSKPLPSGYTLKDLEMWVAYLTKPSWSEGEHARDLKKRFAAEKM